MATMAQYLVRDIMTPRPLTVDVDVHLSDAAKLMGEKHIRHLVVTERGVPVGILSEKDLHDAVPSVNLVPDPEERRRYLERSRVYQVATMKPESVTSESSVLEAIHRLRRLRVGSLPVMDHDQLVGILTAGDLITLLERILRGQGLEELRAAV